MRTVAILPLPAKLILYPELIGVLKEAAEEASDIGLIFIGQLPSQPEPEQRCKEFQSFLIEVYSLLLESRQNKCNWWGGNIDVWFDAFWQPDWIHKARMSGWDIIFSTPSVFDSLKGANVDDVPYKRVVDSLGGTQTVGSERVHVGVHQTVALGGTFDHLHAGHKVLLTLAVYLSIRRVVVGVTGEHFFFRVVFLAKKSGPALLTRKNNAEILESIHTRKATVDAFVRRLAPQLECDIFTLDDVYGPTATDSDIDGIVVSTETLSGSDAINAKRQENKIKELDVFVIDLVDQSAELKLSSTQIRKELSKATADTD
ncbi:hypothetical protein E3P92_00230 [Wallemia ichthyophaga]|uniref:Cytidyltransferase-like domain-containing protein n=2 Tax=Wallemia ichthyophaga TaxID=245174 RepID=A0A4T0FYV0_WALIC|nr:uncharacterized protein J056_000284 [Wallemia ichthyophaga EXF-994]TIA93505.1 hypothetical protein E3P97_00922 [Wallemia ichthyophaga]EOR04927.1 hypothetical protein J056_000284 [Wallemia ichthyophaga EXF-994]TIB00745.1 hypothetical protein E3P95_01558 [Wallemia ichthyophaga]TIB01018.1 hypothetical protein E3P94_01944 [Wallemia ichthyophaga]TIB06312.1 hypothetical protein E3P96_00584 [Wallemia ichthyophaga]